MSATDLFRAGQLAEAIDAQIQEVKRAPADHGKRLFLFELLAFSGDLDRATRQIDAVKYDDPETDAAVASYRALLESERKRRRVFREGLEPTFFGEPGPHVRKRLEALNCFRGKQYAEAQRLLEDANAAPDLAGTLNGKPFTSLRDGDDLFGATLEVMAHGEYFWTPLDQIESLTMTAPKYPRDLLWAAGRLELRDGASGDVFLPVLYPSTHEHADPNMLLGRATDWIAHENGPTLGVGLRTFFVDDEPATLLEWRSLVL